MKHAKKMIAAVNPSRRQTSIWNLSSHAIEAIKHRAENHGLSVSAYLRRILERKFGNNGQGQRTPR